MVSVTTENLPDQKDLHKTKHSRLKRSKINARYIVSTQEDLEVRPKNILITGLPGSGKTTLVEKIVRQLDVPVAGFITREIRERGNRLGFSIDTFDGQSGVLAHVDFKSGYRVGRYGVQIETIDKIAVTSLNPSATDVLIVIDEIGKMVLFRCIQEGDRGGIGFAQSSARHYRSERRFLHPEPEIS